MWIARSGDIYSGDHTHQRMIPAFGLRHDREMLDVLDVVSRLPRLARFDGAQARIAAAGNARFYPD
jgi:hypothetical protein